MAIRFFTASLLSLFGCMIASASESQPSGPAVGDAGFRVHIFASKDSGETVACAEIARTQFADPVHVVFQKPFFRAQVGAYRSREDAGKTVETARELGYAASWIIASRIVDPPPQEPQKPEIIIESVADNEGLAEEEIETDMEIEPAAAPPVPPTASKKKATNRRAKGTGDYYVQLGITSNEVLAESFALRMRTLFSDPIIVQQKQSTYRIKLGPLASIDRAWDIKVTGELNGIRNIWVIEP